MNREIIICDCNSLDHQIVIWWDEEDKLIYAYIHLVSRKNFFQRLGHAIKYVFGYKSRFGAWDEFIFSEEAEESLQKYLENARNSRSKTN
jgi:hypothetical protein